MNLLTKFLILLLLLSTFMYSAPAPKIYGGGSDKKIKENKILSVEKQLKEFSLPKGFEVNAFASEKEFPFLANPIHMEFDRYGRLWVAVSPTYPHYLPGKKSNDKIIILEDTNKDGKADKQTVFADDLYIPTGFALVKNGAYIAQQGDIYLYTDTDGDWKADRRKPVLSGFMAEDSHHTVSAWRRGWDGAIYFAVGVFGFNIIETPFGLQKSRSSSAFRFEPNLGKFHTLSNTYYPNPWGLVFDRWGAGFLTHTSNPKVVDFDSIQVKYNFPHQVKVQNIVLKRGRPISGGTILSSAHFPKEYQGAYLHNQSIAFHGTHMDRLEISGSSFKHVKSFYKDTGLLRGANVAYRPVVSQIGPDGAMYIMDFANTRIGHLQFTQRDKLRDHAHGRIWRVTYKGRPLSKLPDFAASSDEQLLELLKSSIDYITDFAGRELSERNKKVILKKLNLWVSKLNKKDKNYSLNLLEALRIHQRFSVVNLSLLDKLMKSNVERARAASVRVLKQWHLNGQISINDLLSRLEKLSRDSSARVRYLVLITLSHIEEKRIGGLFLNIIKQGKLDYTMKDMIKDIHKRSIKVYLSEAENIFVEKYYNKEIPKKIKLVKHLENGKKLYLKSEGCTNCHQSTGKGISGAFPPLAGSKWVTGDKKKLILIALHGVRGPIKVKGKNYNSYMNAMGPVWNDSQLADILSYVRHAWGNNKSRVYSREVKELRKKFSSKKGSWLVDELNKVK